MKSFLIFILLLINISGRWTPQQASAWYAKYNWAAGVNYTPAYACNQIEFWSSYKEAEISKQLSWAKEVGFSKLRVFLHIQPYIDDPRQFFVYLKNFLGIAQRNKIGIIFVLFDDCWNPQFHSGKQPQPIPGIHNSQWVQMPGNFPQDLTLFKMYVQDIIGTFKNDPNVVMWDLYNQAGNSGHYQGTLPLLKMVFQWARQSNPSQPLTSGHWSDQTRLSSINQFIFSQSDVMTFHAYCDYHCTQSNINRMKTFGRPVICTEYMARPMESKFITHLPLFKKQNVWAINWGFVFGRTQTYFPWWSHKDDPVPAVWFHDVLKPDGSPFDPKQTEFIRNITIV